MKRIRSADREGSPAMRLFASAWHMLVTGVPAGAVMERVTAAALAALRLGDLDRRKLLELGLSGDEATAVLERAFDEVASELDPTLAARLRPALAEPPASGPTPPFVTLLAAQPRAGVTCPGKPRLMLEPAESHADHCLAVAVAGVLLAPAYGADPVSVFVADLAHHLHNAEMPDSGFTGEVLLGSALDGVIARARDRALATLPLHLAARIRIALEPIAAVDTPEARAFHAADVLDRVLEIESHLIAGAATMELVLHDYELVHAGPVKAFHDRVLTEAGLL